MSAGNSSPSVSVVIGSYNAEAWIRETLDSVLVQTYPILQVLVVDDGSSDKTPEIVRSYSGKVKYMREVHRGRPYRNRGIREAEGDFIAFVDADDLWQPEKIERQMALLEARRLAWAICQVRWLDFETTRLDDARAPRIPEGDILEPLFLTNFIGSGTPVVARQVFDAVGYFNETPEVQVVEDWDLWLRIAARFPVGCVQEPLAMIRLHSASFLASTPVTDRVRSLETVVQQAADREPLRLAPTKTRALANIYHAAGVQLIRVNLMREARQYFLRELKCRPVDMEAAIYLLLTLVGPTLANPILCLKRSLWRLPDWRRQR